MFYFRGGLRHFWGAMNGFRGLASLFPPTTPMAEVSVCAFDAT